MTDLVVCRVERASARGGGAKEAEEVSRDEPTPQPPAHRPATSTSGRSRERLREDVRFADERVDARRVKPFGFRIGRSLAVDREQPVRIADLVDAEDEALRIVNTTVTSPRPIATVITIVSPTSGARRKDRPAYRTSRTTLSTGIGRVMGRPV